MKYNINNTEQNPVDIFKPKLKNVDLKWTEAHSSGFCASTDPSLTMIDKWLFSDSLTSEKKNKIKKGHYKEQTEEKWSILCAGACSDILDIALDLECYIGFSYITFSYVTFWAQQTAHLVTIST